MPEKNVEVVRQLLPGPQVDFVELFEAGRDDAEVEAAIAAAASAFTEDFVCIFHSLRRFPGWRWVAVAVAFPIAGLIGWTIGGRVDAVDATLVGGALTGAGLGAVQWWAGNGALGRPAAWISTSAAGYAVGLTAGAALVGYETDLGALAITGLVSGAVLGGAQGLVLARQGHRRLAVPWAASMPVLFALGWCATTLGGIDVDKQFTVFGAYGAVAFTLLSGLLLARFTPARAHAA